VRVARVSFEDPESPYRTLGIAYRLQAPGPARGEWGRCKRTWRSAVCTPLRRDFSICAAAAHRLPSSSFEVGWSGITQRGSRGKTQRRRRRSRGAHWAMDCPRGRRTHALTSFRHAQLQHASIGVVCWTWACPPHACDTHPAYSSGRKRVAVWGGGAESMLRGMEGPVGVFCRFRASSTSDGPVRNAGSESMGQG
jgi:hypothetical protein